MVKYQAVILAAGKGTRWSPLTLTCPKPIFKIGPFSILEHNLNELSSVVREVIIVVGYQKEKIQSLIGGNYKGLRIKYVVQNEQLGTAHAAKKALPFLKGKFILMNGDDLYSKEDIRNCLKKFPCILLKKVEDPSFFGQIVVKRGFVQSIIEKPPRVVSNLVNTGLYFVDKSIFNYGIEKSKRGELEFTDYLKKLAKTKLYFQLAKSWLPISYSWDVLNANQFFLENLKSSRLGKIEKGVVIKGKIYLGKGSLIKSGAYIEGPVYIGRNSQIGPNCYLRKFTSIGNNCLVGQAVEIKNSVIGDFTHVAHLSYVGDSIIGQNCNFGAGTITANLRHDKETVKSMVKNKLVDTKRVKFGTVFGDFVKTGIGTLIYPGRKIWPYQSTLPNQVIKKDIK